MKMKSGNFQVFCFSSFEANKKEVFESIESLSFVFDDLVFLLQSRKKHFLKAVPDLELERIRFDRFE